MPLVNPLASSSAPKVPEASGLAYPCPIVSPGPRSSLKMALEYEVLETAK